MGLKEGLFGQGDQRRFGTKEMAVMIWNISHECVPGSATLGWNMCLAKKM